VITNSTNSTNTSTTNTTKTNATSNSTTPVKKLMNTLIKGGDGGSGSTT
jgi:hypothetical protein